MSTEATVDKQAWAIFLDFCPPRPTELRLLPKLLLAENAVRASNFSRMCLWCAFLPHPQRAIPGLLLAPAGPEEQMCEILDFADTATRLPTSRLEQPHPDKQVHQCDKIGPDHKFLFSLSICCDLMAFCPFSIVPSCPFLVSSTQDAQERICPGPSL